MSNGLNSETCRILVPQIFCRACVSPLVQVDGWERESRSQWKVRIWCPECGSEQVAILDHPQVVYLSLAVEEGFAWMLEALAQIQTLLRMDPVDPGGVHPDLIERACSERIEPTSL